MESVFCGHAHGIDYWFVQLFPLEQPDTSGPGGQPALVEKKQPSPPVV
jgi:hypothetical protein